LDDVVTWQELGALDGADCEARDIVVTCASLPSHGGRCRSKCSKYPS
jgi:hypothetical protein